MSQRSVSAVEKMREHTIQLLGCLLVMLPLHTIMVVANEAVDDPQGIHDDGEVEEEEEAALAVLFPSFTLTIGVMIFYILSRYLRSLPYTAVMFLVGALMGISVGLGGRESQLSKTLTSWISIVRWKRCILMGRFFHELVVSQKLHDPFFLTSVPVHDTDRTRRSSCWCFCLA